MKLLVSEQYLDDAAAVLRVITNQVQSSILDVAKSLGIDSRESFLKVFVSSCASLHECKDHDELVAMTSDWETDAGGNYRIYTDKNGLVHGMWIYPELDHLGTQLASLYRFSIQSVAHADFVSTVDFEKFIDELMDE